jgi:hypothetical protein
VGAGSWARRCAAVTEWITVRRGEGLGRKFVAFSLTPSVAIADPLFESVPFRLLGVTILLSRIAVLASWSPVLVSRALVSAARSTLAWFASTPRVIAFSFGPWSLPPALTAAEPGVFGGVTRIEELAAFEPLHDH